MDDQDNDSDADDDNDSAIQCNVRDRKQIEMQWERDVSRTSDIIRIVQVINRQTAVPFATLIVIILLMRYMSAAMAAA